MTHRGRVKELESYTRAVILEEPNITGSWTPSADRWPKDTKLQVSSIYLPLEHAHRCVVWTEGALDAVGSAMQAWRGDGFVNGLTGVILKRYISKPPPGPRTDTKTSLSKIPPRYRSAAVVKVARLVHDHGAKLRRLLNISADSEDAKPMHVVLAELQAQNAKLQQQLNEEQASVKRLQDAWRKAAWRLKTKNHAVTEARRDERSKLKEAHSTFKANTKVEAKKAAEEAVQDELKRANRLRNEANARVREAVTESAKHQRKVRRLEKKLEDDEEMDEADDEMECSDEEEDPTCRLPFELLPRRDESGRWQAESPELHGVRMAQSARGVAPSTISANIQDPAAPKKEKSDVNAFCEM